MDILPITKAISSSRKLKILHLLSQTESLSTTEIYKKLNEDSYIQYVYKDLNALRKIGLISREYNDDINGFIYSLSHEIISINFKDQTVTWKD